MRLYALTELHDPEAIDHRVPLNDGGDHTLANLELLCKTCHTTTHSALSK
jgi:5-methylcytosine-specific restriction endonuclease McrA